MRAFALLFAATLSAGACATSGDEAARPHRVDLCEVARDPARFDDSFITVEGVLWSNRHQPGGLLSEACPRTMLILAASTTKPRHYDEAWDRYAEYELTRTRAVRVRVTGYFDQQSPLAGGAFDARSYDEITLIPYPSALQSWMPGTPAPAERP